MIKQTNRLYIYSEFKANEFSLLDYFKLDKKQSMKVLTKDLT